MPYFPVLDLLWRYVDVGDQDEPRTVSVRVTGQVLMPETELAETYTATGLALAEALGMRPLVTHCHRGLGTLYSRTEQRQQARTELSTATALYRTMDMTFWLPQAEAALAQVEEQ